jgi:hypothetical protein
MKESMSVRALDQRLQNVAGDVANAVVGQMLPPGAVRGRTAMKICLGESGSRFTPDLDTARRESLEQSSMRSRTPLRRAGKASPGG